MTTITDPKTLKEFGVSSELLDSLAAKALRLEIDGNLVRIQPDYPGATDGCLFANLLRDGKVNVVGIWDFLLGFTTALMFSQYRPQWQTAVDKYNARQLDELEARIAFLEEKVEQL